MHLILISGLSGSGKSIALRALEDAGYYCVDNLPATLLPLLVRQQREEGCERMAVAIDVRAGASIAALPQVLRDLRVIGTGDTKGTGGTENTEPCFLFLEARDETLIARFSETRRSHPLSNLDTTLAEAIVREREMLENIAGLGNRIDTSSLHPNALRAWILDFARLGVSQGLTLLFESFGFKHGIPLDADLVFDVRCLPNPHYDPLLRPLTGRDAEVVRFLEGQEPVRKMAQDIRRFLADWLPAYVRDNRSYLTVALGCTGGQHRSVYLAEWLAREFNDQARVLVRHRAIT
ncbi:MAG: RNase adapter RapZ [Betaproteobacteria bacterium]|nr:RNase adapter RapZ [Betaproteobacteria bacterium]